MGLKLTFSDSTKNTILEVLNKTIDEDGYIIEADTKEKVLDINGEEIEFEEFAGVIKGSEKYIKDDFHSIVELSRLIKRREKK